MIARASDRLVKLSELAELNPRLGCKPELDSSVSFVPMAAVSSEMGTIVEEETRPYAEVSKGYTPFENGDVLVAKITPCFENNKIAQAQLSLPLGFGSTEFHVVRARQGLADPRYLLHFLRQDHVRSEGERKMTGSAGQRRVPEHFLASLEIPFPPLPEQRRIAAILDQADALRAKRREALAKLDEMAQAIFVEMFGDPASDTQKYPVQTLAEVSELINGDRSSNYPSGDDLVEYGVPFLSTKNIRGAEFDLSNCNFITEKKFKSLSRGKLQRHDLVITLRGTLGQCAEFDCEFDTGFINAQMMIIRPRTKLLSGYVREFISNPYTQAKLQRGSSGSAIPQLTAKQVGELSIPVPPLDIQHLFFQKLSDLAGVVNKCRESSQKTENFFSSLQHRAFSGTL